MFVSRPSQAGFLDLGTKEEKMAFEGSFCSDDPKVLSAGSTTCFDQVYRCEPLSFLYVEIVNRPSAGEIRSVAMMLAVGHFSA